MDKKWDLKVEKGGKKKGGGLTRVGTDYTGAAARRGNDGMESEDEGNTIQKLQRRDSDEAMLIMPSKKKQNKKRKKRGFGAGAQYYQIDDEDDVPKLENVDAVFRSLKKIYAALELIDRLGMSTGDVANLLHVLMNIQDRLRNEIRLRSFDMELTQELFCKSLEKAMEKSLKSDYNYNKPFHEWTQVAREAASVFQQVRDLEQGHVTLGQVRETLLWIPNDITSLCSLTRMKNKSTKLKGSDQMVDHDLWWSFLLNHWCNR